MSNESTVVEYGIKVQDLAKRLGISPVAVQRWAFAFEQNGATIEQVCSFFERLAAIRKEAIRGNAEHINAFRRLRVSQTSRLEDIADAIAMSVDSGEFAGLLAAAPTISDGHIASLASRADRQSQWKALVRGWNASIAVLLSVRAVILAISTLARRARLLERAKRKLWPA